MSNKEYLSALEDAFWAGYNTRQKQLDISLDTVFNVGYQRLQISEREMLEKMLDDKRGDIK